MKFRARQVADPLAQQNFEQLEGAVWPDPVSTLPPHPFHGQEVDFIVSSGGLWTFKYDASISDAYKWRFKGGPPLFSGPQGLLTMASATWTALTGGPSLTVPFTGGYVIYHELHSQQQVGGLADQNSSLRNGAGNFGFATGITGQDQWTAGHHNRKNTQVLTAADVISLNVRNSNALSTTFTNGYIEVIPTRVAG